MRALIAIGSNSIRMLYVDENKSKHAFREENPLFLGLDANGSLSEDAIEKTLRAIFALKENIPKGCPCSLIATSASRDANNAGEMAEKIQARCGLSLRILSGEEEAHYSFLGACFPYASACGMIDIGGGSSELVAGDSGKALFKTSLQMGASRLHKVCPIDDIASMEKAISLINEQLCKENIPSFSHPFVLLGGTGTILVRMLSHMGKALERNVHGDHKASSDDVERILHLVSKTPVSQRKNIAGLYESRIRIFPCGLAILLCFMRELGLQHIWISERNNMDGIIFEEENMDFIKEPGRIYKNDESGKCIAEICYAEKEKGLFDINHTFVDASLRGQGVGGKLVDAALLDIRELGGKATASCWFAKKILEEKK